MNASVQTFRTDDGCFDVMVDLETLGTRPDKCHIIQIAAVAFNRHTGEIHHESFDRCLHLSEYRHTHKDTLEFWRGSLERRQIFQRIQTRAEPIVGVLEDFRDWVNTLPAKGGKCFWGNNGGFDWFFLAGYFKDYAITNPFNPYYQMELKSYVSGLAGGQIYKTLDKPMREHHHDALHDVLYQIKILLMYQKKADQQLSKIEERLKDLQRSNLLLKGHTLDQMANTGYDLDDDLPF